MTPPPALQELIETVRQDSPSDDLLDLLVTASSTVAQLEDLNDALLGHFVDRCRRAGRSWSEISNALGVSKQAVHKRFSGALAGRVISSGSPLTLERCTARARSTLSAASHAARSLGAGSVGSEHLLLGLFGEPDGLAAKALSAMTVSRAAVEAALHGASASQGTRCQQATTGPADTAAPPGLPFSPEAAAALRDALAEALDRAHNYVGTEHLLLGLYRNPGNRAAKILGSLGAGHAEAEVRISEMLGGFSPRC
jgi:ATP-dependent Clp protease ATP-binding subunit ClpA